MRYVLAILLCLLFSISSFACEFLIYAQRHWMELVDRSNWTKAQLEKYERAYRKGDIVVIMPDGHKWGKLEGPPKFVIVKVPGLSVEEAKKYRASWFRTCSLSLVAHDTTNDTYDVEIRADLVSPSGIGKITKDEVIDRCKQFDITILDYAENYVKVRIKETHNFNVLKEKAKTLLSKVVRRRRFHIPESFVDEILKQGGVIELDKAKALEIVKDKVKDE